MNDAEVTASVAAMSRELDRHREELKRQEKRLSMLEKRLQTKEPDPAKRKNKNAPVRRTTG